MAGCLLASYSDLSLGSTPEHLLTSSQYFQMMHFATSCLVPMARKLEGHAAIKNCSLASGGSCNQCLGISMACS